MIKRLLSPTPLSADRAIDLATLTLRLAFGVLMLRHGYRKLTEFSQIAPEFLDFLGMGSTLSLALATFAEFFCSILLMVGLLTRLSLLPLLTTMVVALVTVSVRKDHPLLYFFPYLALFLIGPGRFSLDHVLFGRRYRAGHREKDES